MAARGIACGAVRAQRTHPCGFRWAIPAGEQHERHHDSHNDLGGVYENYVVQELVAHGFDAHYYSGKRVGELDAVVERCTCRCIWRGCSRPRMRDLWGKHSGPEAVLVLRRLPTKLAQPP